MFASSHATVLGEISIEALRKSRAKALEADISSGAKTVGTARVRILLDQLTISAAQELGLAAYFDDTGLLPKELPLSALPCEAVSYIVSRSAEIETLMALRDYLIKDAQNRGTDLPELGVPGRHVMRAGTTKIPGRPSVRLAPNGRDAAGQVIQLPYAIPTYGSDGSLSGFAKNVHLKSGVYGNMYDGYHGVCAENGRLLTIHASADIKEKLHVWGKADPAAL